MTEERRCLETGELLPPNMHPGARFLTNEAKVAWGNRRKTRGAALYDMFMAFRYNRPLAKKLHLFGQMCKLAAEWHAEDRAANRIGYTEPVEPPPEG